MWECSNCGRENAEEYAFCPICGRSRDARFPSGNNRTKWITGLVVFIAVMGILAARFFPGGNENVDPDRVVKRIERTLVKYDGVTVRLKNISVSNQFTAFGETEYKLNLECSNRSGKDYTVQVEELYVCGYRMAGIGTDIVPAGRSAWWTVDLGYSLLNYTGLESIDRIALRLSLEESDSYSPVLETELIEINLSLPIPLSPERAENYEILNEYGLRLSLIGTAGFDVQDGTHVRNFMVMLENNTSLDMIDFQTETSGNYVNDRQIEYFFGAYGPIRIDAGERGLYIITVMGLTDSGREKFDIGAKIEWCLTNCVLRGRMSISTDRAGNISSADGSFTQGSGYEVFARDAGNTM